MFTLGQLVRLKTKSIRFAIVGVIGEEVAPNEVVTTYRIRHQRSYGNPFEFVVSGAEIEAAEVDAKPDATPPGKSWHCPTCSYKVPGFSASCPYCPRVTWPITPESVALENGQTATVQATIQATARRRGTEHVRRIEEEIRKAKAAPEVTPVILADLANQRMHAEGIGTLKVLPLEWDDSPSESNTIPDATYQVDQGPNGWHAYYYEGGKGATPDLESDHAMPTREAAKAWAERHAAGEELEPRRCTKCQMPLDANEHSPLCLACFNTPGQSVAVGVNGVRQVVGDLEIPF